MSEPAPHVAVVIPCYNHGEHLPEAVESVRAQTCPHVAVVVVDDGSTDAATRAAVARLRTAGVEVIRQENQGLAAARNAGVRATTTPFFVPLDADDRLEPRFVERLIQPLLADGRLGYCYSHVRFVGARTGVWRCPEYDVDHLLLENLSVATAVVRRAAFDAVGGYSGDMRHGFEDWDFWIALAAAGYGGRCVREALFRYRRHAGGSMLDETYRNFEAMVRTMMEHHRALFARRLGFAGRATPPGVDELYAARAAALELHRIERSRAWRAVQRLSGNRLGRRLLQTGPNGVTHDPHAELARIRASRAYRIIRRLKRNRLYGWYARRKYGREESSD